jgi:IclR family KDG regulon transcriptional repressor
MEDENYTAQTILSVERALLILKRLAQSGEEIGVRDLSRELGYSPAVTQKILNTLKAHNFVRQNEKTDRYTLGGAVLQIGMAVLARLDVIHISQPYIKALSAESGETTFLAIREDSSAIYVAKETSSNPVRMDADLGVDRPLNCTAVGKILLGFSESEDIQQLARSGALLQATENSITDPEKLAEELRQVRQQGYAVDMMEFHPEAICVAAPIYSPEGKVVAALTISGVASRMQPDLEYQIALVKEAAGQISAELGYPHQAPSRALA